jgi:hypothetical protein
VCAGIRTLFIQTSLFKVTGAETVAIDRSIRTCRIDLPAPWGPSATVERNMNVLKFYYDLSSGECTETIIYNTYCRSRQMAHVVWFMLGAMFSNDKPVSKLRQPAIKSSCQH